MSYSNPGEDEENGNNSGQSHGQNIDTVSVLREIRQLKEHLLAIESNTTETKIKEMVWYPTREDHVNVYLRASVVMVGDIDAVRQEFLCEFYLSVKWKEPRLKGRTADSQVDWDSEWEPDIYFVDMVSSDIFERHRGFLDEKPEDDIPTVFFYYHIRGIFKEVLDVRTFPFDYQELDIIVTTNFEKNRVTLLKDPERSDNIRTWNFASKQQWELQPHVLASSKETHKEIGSSSNIFSLYHIKMHAVRKWSFYVSNIAFVMALITSLTFTSFAVDTDSTGDRLAITLTLLLASVAFKYYVEGFLPTVPYLTMIESYIHSCFVFQVIVTILNAASGVIKRKETLKIFEWVSFGFAVFLFVMIHLVYCMRMALALSNRNLKKKKHNQMYMDSLLNPNDKLASGPFSQLEEARTTSKSNFTLNKVSPNQNSLNI